MINKAMIALLLCFSAISAWAQPTPAKSKEEVVAYCNKFMQSILDGKSKEAVLSLKTISYISNAEIDKLAITAEDQLSKLEDIYGKVTSYDFVMEKSIKDYLYKRYFVLRYERYYVKFMFTIYKGATGWMISGFVYNEDIEELMK